MVTIFDLYRNKEKLSDKELQELFRCVDAYKGTIDGTWLNDIDYHCCNYYWKIDWRNSDVQAARPLFGNQIVMQPYGFMYLSAAPAIHELRHMWQRKKYGLLIYSILSVVSRIPGLYEKVSLEKDAFDQQEKAEKYITKHCQ